MVLCYVENQGANHCIFFKGLCTRLNSLGDFHKNFVDRDILLFIAYGLLGCYLY